MVEDTPAIQDVGAHRSTGDARGEQAIALIVLSDDPRAAEHAAAAYRYGKAGFLPHYHIDRRGAIRRFIDEARAGRGLGLAHAGGLFAEPIDPRALSVVLQKRATAGYDGPLLRALHRLLADLVGRHQLGEEAVVRLVGDGRRRAVPYVPPPPPRLAAAAPLAPGGEQPGPTAESASPLPPADVAGDLVLGAAARPAPPASAAAELWRFLYAESFKPSGANLDLEWAFPIYAAAKGLGAPVAANRPAPLLFGGEEYNYQPFARDTVFNEGKNYAAVQSLNELLGPIAVIPPRGLAFELLSASYRDAVAASVARGLVLSGKPELNPGWKFHQVARANGLGPALSGNYLTADKRYIVQVFAGDTLYTPVSQQSGCYRLSETDPAAPAYRPIWAETYRVSPARYDPESPFQRMAARLRLGAPLSAVYAAEHAGQPYTLQIFALDTLYRGPDGQLRLMGELEKPELIAWPPDARQLLPRPPGPRQVAVDVGPPRRADPRWPPPPPFAPLFAQPGGAEAALGEIRWVRAASGDPDAIRITNGWNEQHLTLVEVPQLRRFASAGGGRIRFHQRAAAQLRQLFADWEAAGLLPLILSFDGAYNPRTIRSTTPGQVTDILSNHAYGTAFDLNAAQNGFMRQPALVGAYGSLRELVPLAYANGFYWGGHFRYPGGGADGMHFEWAVPL
jgi:hypothetical protein